MQLAHFFAEFFNFVSQFFDLLHYFAYCRLERWRTLGPFLQFSQASFRLFGPASQLIGHIVLAGGIEFGGGPMQVLDLFGQFLFLWAEFTRRWRWRSEFRRLGRWRWRSESRRLWRSWRACEAGRLRRLRPQSERWLVWSLRWAKVLSRRRPGFSAATRADPFQQAASKLELAPDTFASGDSFRLVTCLLRLVQRLLQFMHLCLKPFEHGPSATLPLGDRADGSEQLLDGVTQLLVQLFDRVLIAWFRLVQLFQALRQLRDMFKLLGYFSAQSGFRLGQAAFAGGTQLFGQPLGQFVPIQLVQPVDEAFELFGQGL